MSKRNPKKIVKSTKTPVEGNFCYASILREQNFAKNSSWLYRFVYSSRVSATMVFLLLISFSLQSAERVYANADDVETSEVSVAEVLEEAKTTESQSVAPEITSIVTEVVLAETAEESPDTVISNTNLSESTQIETNQTNFNEQTADNLTSELNDSDNSSSVELFALSTSSDLETTEEVLVDIDNESISNTDFNLEETISTSLENIDYDSTDGELENEQLIATSTEEIILEPEFEVTTETTEALETTNESVSVTQSDSEFSFTKDECTQLATGSFYCRQPDLNQLKDALFSAPDEDGDLEIFLIRDGLQVQVTTNQMDDAAPYFDSNSNTIVWHRLINDRYQIISYDVDRNEERQISNTPENNMEPTRQGEYTVWQRWVNGGWNIILLNGDTETQITRNVNSNIAPYIHGSLVVWNSKDKTGEKTIEMFDIVSRTYVTVDDPDGMSVSNPRMVFVYDSLHPNGDIVTKGYDVLAKKFIDLDSLPRELPEELPPADSTGETRALIQSKPVLKSDAEESVNSSSTPDFLPPVPLDVSSSTNEMTLDLSQTSSTTDFAPVSNGEEIDENLALVIEPFIASEATSNESVQD